MTELWYGVILTPDELDRSFLIEIQEFAKENKLVRRQRTDPNKASDKYLLDWTSGSDKQDEKHASHFCGLTQIGEHHLGFRENKEEDLPTVLFGYQYDSVGVEYAYKFHDPTAEEKSFVKAELKKRLISNKPAVYIYGEYI